VILDRLLAINILQISLPTGQAARAHGLSFAFSQIVSTFVPPPETPGAAL